MQEDTLLSPMERKNLIAKLSNASLTWNQVNHIFTKIIFIPDDNSKQSQAKQDLFGGSEPIEVDTEDLPF